MKTKVLVLQGDGINCERETAAAFVSAGGEVGFAAFRDLKRDPEMLLRHQIFALPGGFSFGDEIVSGQVAALALKEALGDTWKRFLERKGIMIGICNGFQILMKTGVFDAPVALVANHPAGFRDEWRGLEVQPSRCVWTKGLEGKTLRLPIRHGEGRIWTPAETKATTLATLKERGQVVMRYDGDPNGSLERIAGLCDPTGQVFGLMPHPEAALRPELYPDASYLMVADLPRRLFENALQHAQENRP